jgi:hypothetical protein
MVPTAFRRDAGLEATGTRERLVPVYKTKRQYASEDNFDINCCERFGYYWDYKE